MRVDVHPRATAEAQDAAEALESARRGYGVAFSNAYTRVLDQLTTQERMYPEAFDAPDGFEAREVYLRRFKFRIVYLVFADAVFVVAVAHAHREPGYWHRRLPDPPAS